MVLQYRHETLCKWGQSPGCRCGNFLSCHIYFFFNCQCWKKYAENKVCIEISAWHLYPKADAVLIISNLFSCMRLFRIDSPRLYISMKHKCNCLTIYSFCDICIKDKYACITWKGLEKWNERLVVLTESCFSSLVLPQDIQTVVEQKMCPHMKIQTVMDKTQTRN